MTGRWSRLWTAVTGREPLPAGFAGTLAAEERVLAVSGDVVATSWGLWPADVAAERVGWHRISKATWDGGALRVVEADEEPVDREAPDSAGGPVLLTDRAPRRIPLAGPGRLPEVVHERVTGSIVSRHHRDLPGGGAWFVQRRVAGRDGTVLQVRPDPGTDHEQVRRLAAAVARSVGAATPDAGAT